MSKVIPFQYVDCPRCADLERQLAEAQGKLDAADGVVLELWGRLTKEEVEIMPEESRQRVYPYLARILKGE